jgi:hypothetical protein
LVVDVHELAHGVRHRASLSADAMGHVGIGIFVVISRVLFKHLAEALSLHTEVELEKLKVEMIERQECLDD